MALDHSEGAVMSQQPYQSDDDLYVADSDAALVNTSSLPPNEEITSARAQEAVALQADVGHRKDNEQFTAFPANALDMRARRLESDPMDVGTHSPDQGGDDKARIQTKSSKR